MTEARRRCEGECGRNRAEKFFKTPKGRVCVTCQKATARKSARKAHLAKTYELTVEEYDALLAAQGGVCAICEQARAYNLQVDHDHAVAASEGIRKSVRGLICKRENKVLRDVRDNPQILRRAADYLDDPPARKVLG